ncbi:MAG: DUF5683 domain-containing protein [Bacteroidales bacterium]
MYAQKNKPHSANKASLYSAILPGLGQAYNKKYWKIPVVYAGFGLMYYFINSNNIEYQKFKDAYAFKSSTDPDPDLYNNYVDKYPLTSLQDGKEYYRRNRDLSIILCSFWYLLNITDAAVDAYLFDYDVSPDLSLKISPFLPPLSTSGRTTPGLTLTMSF